MERRWVNCTSAAGNDLFARDLKKLKLTVVELSRLQALMERVRTQKTMRRDVDSLGDGIFEIRSITGRTKVRLFYAEVDDGLVVLALHVIKKKKQRVDSAIELARDRFRVWSERHC